jgi:gentisate 1,2-dioxygenase
MTQPALAEAARAAHLVPLWEVMRGMLPAQPQPAALAHRWAREAWRGPLLEAGTAISAEEAERRVLLLENPAYPGESRVTATTHAGLQLLLPGETAAPHRHAQAALRFVVEGQGAHTRVDGVPQAMRPGDFILTPAFTWHEHANGGDAPVVWLDGLDLPLVRLLGTTFAQFTAAADPFAGTGTRTATARLGRGLMPAAEVDHAKPSGLVAYPYDQARAALDNLAGDSAIDAAHGYRLHYADPAHGGHAMPTLAAYLQLLPRGFDGALIQSTEHMVYCVHAGSGRTIVCGADGAKREFDWSPGDLLVVPGWLAHRHAADGEAVLFSFSDAAAQQRLGLWRERRA